MANKITDLVDKIAVVLDLGTTSLRAMAATIDSFGKVNEVLAAEEYESPEKSIKDGCVYNINLVANSIKIIISRLQNKLNTMFCPSVDGVAPTETIKITSVYVALNGKSIKTVNATTSRNCNGDIIDHKLLTDLESDVKLKPLCNETEEILEIIKQEYIVDDEDELEPEGTCCYHSIVGRYKVVIASRTLRINLEQTLAIAGLKIKKYIIAPVASSQAVITDIEKEFGVLMIDFGATATTMAIYTKNVLRHVCVIRIAGEHITDDIRTLKLTRIASERLKVANGLSLKRMSENVLIDITNTDISVHLKDLSELIEKKFDNIEGYIMGQLEESGYRNEISLIVLTGGTSKMKYLDTKIQEDFVVDTIIRNDFRHTNSIYSDFFSVNTNFSPNKFFTCVGLLDLASESCTSVEYHKKEEEVPVSKAVRAKKSKKEGGTFLKTFLSISNKFKENLERTLTLDIQDDEEYSNN